MPRNRFMLPVIDVYATLRTLFYFYREGVDRLGLDKETGYTSPLKTHHTINIEAKSNVAQFVYTMHRVAKLFRRNVIF